MWCLWVKHTIRGIFSADFDELTTESKANADGKIVQNKRNDIVAILFKFLPAIATVLEHMKGKDRAFSSQHQSGMQVKKD